MAEIHAHRAEGIKLLTKMQVRPAQHHGVPHTRAALGASLGEAARRREVGAAHRKAHRLLAQIACDLRKGGGGLLELLPGDGEHLEEVHRARRKALQQVGRGEDDIVAEDAPLAKHSTTEERQPDVEMP